MTAAVAPNPAESHTVEEFDPFNPPPPNEADERARLARALNLTDRFALFVATCNRADVRQEIVAEIKAENPTLRLVEVTVDRTIPNLLAHLSTLPDVRDADAVFVSGLESFLPNTEEVAHSSFVVNLNGTRDAFPNTLSCPLVLWLADYARNGLMRGAPDFYSIRSASFVFATPMPDAPKIEKLISSSGYSSAWHIPFQERDKRVKELSDLLTQLQSLPDSEQNLFTIVTVANRLAGLYSAYGQFTDAVSVSRHTYLQCVRFLGELHSNSIFCLGNLAASLYNLGRIGEAEKLLERGLSRIVLGDDSNELIAFFKGKLVVIYQDQGKLYEAERLLNEVMSIEKIDSIIGHMEYIELFNCMAKNYCLEKRLFQATPFFIKAYELAKVYLGLVHPNTLTILHNIGAVRYEQGSIELGKETMKSVLDVRQLSLGPEHPDVAKSLCSIANCYQKEGRLQDAKNLYLEAELIHKKAFGSKHPYTLQVKQNVSELSNLIRVRQAFQPMQIGLKKKQKVSGKSR